MILALDYDGVLVNSAKESFAVGYNLYIKLYGFKHFSNKTLNYKNFARINTELKNLQKGFSHLRAYCGIACSYARVLAALDTKIIDKTSFEKFKTSITKDNKFRIMFHRERDRLQKENFKAFVSLTPVHKEVIKGTKKLFNLENQVFIVTKNKKELIWKVLSANNFNVPIEHIFDAYSFANKKQGIKQIIKNTNVKSGDIIYIDDHLKHLQSLDGMGVKVFLADWGFVSKEDITKAKQLGIPVLTKRNFYQKIKQIK